MNEKKNSTGNVGYLSYELKEGYLSQRNCARLILSAFFRVIKVVDQAKLPNLYSKTSSTI